MVVLKNKKSLPVCIYVHRVFDDKNSKGSLYSDSISGKFKSDDHLEEGGLYGYKCLDQYEHRCSFLV